jgi:hypothetical protein
MAFVRLTAITRISQAPRRIMALIGAVPLTTKRITMRGPDNQQDTLFSTVSLETRVPKDQPLRPIRQMVDQALKALDNEFSALYSVYGRESIPPEKLLRAQLLMALYTIRSGRQRRRPTRGRWSEPLGRLPRREAQSRHPRVEDG